jgi:hypothetical protein
MNSTFREAHKVINPSHCDFENMTDALDNLPAIAVLRLVLDEVFGDPRFFARQSMSASQIADFVMTEVLRGEHDIDRLKASAFERILRRASNLTIA